MTRELNREDKRRGLRSHLSPAQQALLEKRLRGDGAAQADSIPRRSTAAPSPLSFAQQRLWFLQQLAPDHAFYNEHAALRLTGTRPRTRAGTRAETRAGGASGELPASGGLSGELSGGLNVAALEQSLSALVQRHEVFRTRFEPGAEPGAGEPVQVIAPSLSLPFEKIDLRHLPAAAQEREWQRLSAEQSQQPFDLSQAPLLRWMLIQLSEHDHVLLFTVHHIIFDGWSIDILIRELSNFYRLFSAKKTSFEAARSLPELPIQYADYAVWQRQWLQGDVLQSQLKYWKQQLDQAPSLLQLPSDRPRPSVQTYRGATQAFCVPKGLTQALRELSRDTGVTLFMTLLTAFKILLHRYTGRDDLIVGSPVANRSRAEVEGLIGVFVNSLALRTDLSGNPTVTDLLQRVRKVMLGAYANQDLPFEKLVEALQPDRNPHYNPLFQVSFTLHNTPRRTFELPGLKIAPLAVNRDRALLDLRLDITETEQGLTGCWEYSTDLFDQARIQRMSGHLQTLLVAVVANPHQRLSELPLLTDAEQQQLARWNQTQIDYPQSLCLHQLFEAQVQRTPDDIALVFEDDSEARQLTYSALNAKANQLAHYLRSLGVQPEGLVGICCDRTPEMVIGLLGILKAGGAYVPLDPHYPKDRLDWMVSDSQMPILLTQETWRDRLPNHQAQVVCWDSDGVAIAQQPDHTPEGEVSSQHLAYVIYTSGSTGKPKGVQICHRNGVNFLHSMQQQPGLTASDTLLAVTSISFDIAALELFLPLITGARLALASRAVATDGERLSRQLAQVGATVMQATPATWRMLLATGWTGQAGLKILCGGEALSGALAQELMAMGATVWNLYGPTETTIWSAVYRLEAQQRDWMDLPVPIGYPIANTQFHILDCQGNSVPVGIPGELHIGGDGLARGYLNRPDLTAERFITHPCWGRLYRTGDLACYRSDGAIDYLGRIDHQVKIRGFRIELGEIEAVLGQHPAVRETVVITHADPAGEARLVAYLVFQPDLQIAPSDLRGFLQEKLPDYMVPGLYMTLEKLPLTPNGKVDRRALPAPAATSLVTASDVPASPLEEMLASLWSRVLNLESVGADDNFFELGGHSLLATQMISQVRQVFHVELPLRRLFELPTVAQLATAIETAMQADAAVPLPTIQRRLNPAVAPLSFAQERMWFLAQLEPETPFYNLPIAISLQGNLNLTALEQTFTEIVRRHQVLRTQIKSSEEGAIAHTAPLTVFSLSLTDLSALADRQAEAQRLMATEAQTPFDLSQDLLLRVRLLRLSEQDHILLLTLHHIAADGWSFGILAREIAALYTVFCNGDPSPLPTLSIQYGDVAVWQRQYLQGEALQGQLDYWRQQLQDAPTLLALPTDRPRPAIQTYRGASYPFQLSSSLSRSLRQLSQQAGCTLFMTLLAAFKVLLGRYSNSTDVVVGTPIANRPRAEVEDLIGCFVNTLVLRSDLSQQPTVLELLARVRDTALSGYAHQDLPFEQLVESLQPERSLSHTPLFQVMFVFQNTPLPEVALPDVQVLPLANPSGTTQFDLTLSLEDSAAGLVGTFEYNCDLFETATITRMAGHYLTLLEGFVTHPQRQISDLPWLTTAEQQQLLEWNQTQTAYAQDACVHHLFEAQVERTPEAIAVVCRGHQLTYRGLNARANQLAHQLQRWGVRPDDLVGVCVERSIDMLVALLGVLKAGGAYLPLDPDYPSERLAFMLQDAQVTWLVTQSSLRDRIPPHQAQVIYLDARESGTAHASQANSVHPQAGHPQAEHPQVEYPQAEHLAYVIYTSGSTGTPKGVMVNHRSLVNYTEAIASAYELTPCDRVLQFASINFDVAAEEIFPALAQGATLVLRTDEMLPSIPVFLQQVQTLGLTVLNLPTAFWHQVTAELAKRQIALSDSLRLMVIGGERASCDRVQTWHQTVGDWVRLVNCYGPTETTIGATLCDLTGPDLVHDLAHDLAIDVPIGKPIQNVQTYVLNADMQPVPVGVPGELYIGGAGVARGYLNRPALTKEKFLSSPLLKGERRKAKGESINQTPPFLLPPSSFPLYKTGDLVRYRPDGNLEYLGRLDTQVKIRGFRIELGEIEAALGQHPTVAATAVIDQEGELGERRLVAYVVADSQAGSQACSQAGSRAEDRAEDRASLSISELRQFLSEKLPAYMVPAVFAQLDALPLMPNGKVDRSALPEPDPAGTDLNKILVSPRTPVETTLAEIWSQVLAIKPVGIHDNFFELGGDSILSLQVVARAHQAGLQFTPKQLFEHQTIAGLAVVAHQRSVMPIEQGLITGSVLLTPIQHWFFEQSFKDPHHFNQSVLFEISQPIDLTVLEQALQQLLMHHDALRLRFTQTASGWQQEHALPSSATHLVRWDFSTLADLEQLSALEAAANELQISLDLARGPLLRAGYFDLGPDQPSRLLIVIHHLVVDGVSWRILLEDLQTAYQQLSQGEPVQLSAKTLSFQQWSHLLRQYAQSDRLSPAQDYWLADSPSIPLPVDFPANSRSFDAPTTRNTAAAAKTIHHTLGFEDTQALLKEVPMVYHTEINDVLLTALVQALAEWAGERSSPLPPAFLIDLEGHGRDGLAADISEGISEDANVSRTVGWFTTVFPVCLSPGGQAHPGESLKHVKEQLRRIPDRGVSYGLLRYLRDEPTLTEALKNRPQADVLFNYLGQFDSTLSDTALFRLVPGSSGPTQSLRDQRSHLLEINSWVSGGQLHLDWIYSQDIHRPTTIKTLAQTFIDALRSLIAHCQSPDAGGYTPSDFSEADLSQADLDRFLANLNRRS